MMRPALGLIAVAWATGPGAQALGAQGAGAGAAPWMFAWSLFAPLAEGVRTLPAEPVLPELAGAPAPRVGLLWTAGAPAGLAHELEDAYGELAVGFAARRGSYRRPLDQDGVSMRRLTAFRWQPVGERGGVMGRVSADYSLSDFGSYSPQSLPYAANPFVITDTTVSGMRLIRTRLEGGAGWRSGGWGLGLVLGLEVADHRTRESALRRLVRWSAPAAAFGLSRALGWSGVTLSAYGRWVGGDETVRFIAWPATGVVCPLHGYSDPNPILVGGSPDRLEYRRFIERVAAGVGLAAGGRALGARWAAFAEESGRRDVHFSDWRKDAPRDRWRAAGRRAGLAVTAAFLGERARVLAFGEYATLDGEGFRADLAQAIVQGEEGVLRTGVEVRYSAADAAWTAAARVETRRDARTLSDFLAEVESDIVAWSPGAALEVLFREGPTTVVSVGAGFATHVAAAAIPDPEFMGEVYRRLLGPQLAVYAARSRTWVAGAAVRRQLGDAMALLLRGAVGRLTPRSEPGAVPLAPEGARRTWSLSLALVRAR